MSNYIVTGGAGFIGHHIVNRLLKDGHKVCVVDDFSRGTYKRVNSVAETWRHDITKPFPDHIVSKYNDGIFHLAALARVPFSLEYPLESNKANAVGTLSVLENAKNAGIENVVYSSSSSVYGNEINTKVGSKEEDNLNPISPYALQKLFGEMYCELYSSIHNMKTIALRYFSVYGPGTSMTDTYNLVLTTFLDQYRKNIKFTITGDGHQRRDFTHVEDVVEANILAMKKLESKEDSYYDVFNIGAGKNYSVNELANLFVNNVGIDHIEKRLEPKNTLANNNKAKNILGWEPTRIFKESVLELIEKEGRLEKDEKN